LTSFWNLYSEGKERLAVSSSQVTLQLKSVTLALLNAWMAV